VLLRSISTPHLCQGGGNYFSILLSPPQPSCFPSHHPFFVILFSFSYSSLLFRLLEARSTENHNLHHPRVPPTPPPPLSASYFAHIIMLHMPPLFLFFYNRSLPSQHFWLSFVELFCSTKNSRSGSRPQQYLIFMVLYTTAPDDVVSIFTFVNLPLTLT
jgi:hypothetical protein